MKCLLAAGVLGPGLLHTTQGQGHVLLAESLV